jgi:ankyrin repeat protein
MTQGPEKHSRPGVDRYGRTALWYAAANGEVSGIALYVSEGLDPSTGDDMGFTPLHVAAQNGHLDTVRCLILHRANPNAHDKYGNGPLWTATHYACLVIATETNRAIVEALLAAGADPHHENAHGRSPFEISMRSQKVRAVFELNGADGSL